MAPEKLYHHDYYYGPVGMTEKNDWHQADFDPKNQVPDSRVESTGVHEPIHQPDAAIQAEIHAAFTSDPAVDPSEIEIAVERGSVQLTGTVASRFMMQRALALASSVPGVMEVENRLHVDRPAGREIA